MGDVLSGQVVPWLAGSALLGLLLLVGAVAHSDVTRRTIPNRLCVAIAVLGVVHAVGAYGWVAPQEIGLRLLFLVLLALPLLLAFGLRMLGGGDVKLLLALVLWVGPGDLVRMLAGVALAGIAIALAMKIAQRVFCLGGPRSVPYGAAIVAGATFVILPQFMGSAAAVCTRLI